MVQIPQDLLVDHKELEFVSKIGAGTNGEVWKAKWGKELVAVKKLVLTQDETPENIKEFENTLHTLLRTHHPRFLRCYGACVPSEHEIWIIMELAEAGNLHTILSDKSKAIPVTTKWLWALAVVSAVEYLHKKKITHKKIKISNFLVVSGEVKVSDYGIPARLAKKGEAHAGLGTTRWLAPETTNEPPDYTSKSDIFALGMVLWQIFERVLPFHEEKDEHKVLVMIKNDKKRPTISKECPPVLGKVISQCWEEDSAKRPSLDEILEVIKVNVSSQNIPVNIPGVLDSKSYRSNREYFEINYPELLGWVEKDQVRTLTNPPRYPIPNVTPQIPSSIDIISLYPPNGQQVQPTNLLASHRYDYRLFGRVSTYFNRFYDPSDPNMKVRLDKVEVICNPYLEEQFSRKAEEFEQKFRGMVELRPQQQSELQREYLQTLLVSENLCFDKNGNPISAFHGVSSKYLESICWYGLLKLSTTDAGYYGKGIYLTQKAKYGEFYIDEIRKKEDGNFSLLLCWVLLGRPYAVTKVQMGATPAPEHTSHYVVVSKKQAQLKYCRSEQDFEMVEGLEQYFPVEQGEFGEGDEIVVFESEQVLPRYIVHYSIGSATQPQEPSPPSPTTSTPTSPEPGSPLHRPPVPKATYKKAPSKFGKK